jgi:O-antigen/teichoic acid export membrane protein
MNKNWNKIKNIASGLKGLAAIGFADIIGNGIAAIFWFYMAIILGAHSYGQVSYFLAIGSVSSTISMIGGMNVLSVYTAKKVRIESSVFFISLVGAMVTSVVVFEIFSNFGVSIYVLGTVISILASSEILGKKLYSSYSTYLILQKILMVGLGIAFYYLAGPNGLILGIALSFFPYCIRIYNGFKESKIDFSLVKTRLGFIMNSYFLNLISAFGGSVDKLIIAPILGFTLLGNYQLGIQFLAIAQVVPAIVYKYTLPHDASGVFNVRLKKMTILFSVVLTVAGIALSPIVIPLLFPKYNEAVTIIQIISLSLVPLSITYSYQSKFLGLEKSKIVLTAQIIYLVTQVIAIIILGKIFGINGVAVALVLSIAAESIFYITTNRSLKVN